MLQNTLNGHELFALITALTAILGIYFEYFTRTQPTIALLITSLLLTLATHQLPSGMVHDSLSQLISSINLLPFDELFLSYMLGILLFSGAIHVKPQALYNMCLAIFNLSILTTLITISMLSIGFYYLGQLMHLPLSWQEAMLLATLIAPTDPIAVLGLLKSMRAPEHLHALIAGESLFNDGVGLVIFRILLLDGSQSMSLSEASLWFIQLSLGGIAMGCLLGWFLGYLLQHPLNSRQKIFCMAAIVIGGFECCELLGVSAALYVVTVGLSAAHHLTFLDEQQQADILAFWQVIDEWLNLMLFLLMGFLALSFHWEMNVILMLSLAIGLLLLCRFISVSLALLVYDHKRRLSLSCLVSWSGLRGALAIALALSLPHSQGHWLITSLAYGMVVFSIIVQGLSSPWLLKWHLGCATKS